MAHHSGQTARGRRVWIGVVIRVVAPIPVLVFLGLAVGSAVIRGDGWKSGVLIGVVGALSYLPFAVSAYEGRYDPG